MPGSSIRARRRWRRARRTSVGFADFPLIAFNFAKTSTVSASLTPVFYAVAMGVSGLGSLLFGRLFDRVGIGILVPLTIVSALFAALVFLGGFWPALVGMSLWGMGMGVHESIVPAAVAPMVPLQRRASPTAFPRRTASRGSWGASRSASCTNTSPWSRSRLLHRR